MIFHRNLGDLRTIIDDLGLNKHEVLHSAFSHVIGH